jgi:hypothetical protein
VQTHIVRLRRLSANGREIQRPGTAWCGDLCHLATATCEVEGDRIRHAAELPAGRAPRTPLQSDLGHPVGVQVGVSMGLETGQTPRDHRVARSTGKDQTEIHRVREAVGKAGHGSTCQRLDRAAGPRSPALVLQHGDNGMIRSWNAAKATVGGRWTPSWWR